MHAEPVWRGTFFVLEDDRGSDTAGNDGVRDGNDSIRLGADLGETSFEKVELVDGTFGALVDNLRRGLATALSVVQGCEQGTHHSFNTLAGLVGHLDTGAAL